MQKIKDCLFADDVLYDVEHDVWVRPKADGDIIMGLDTIMVWLSGPLTSVTFKPIGTVVQRGSSIGAIEGPRHFDTVKSPVTGAIVEVNAVLGDDPKLVNRDPYGRGWLVKLRPLEKGSATRGLLDVASAREALAGRVDEFRVRCFAAFPDYEMFEIGSECSGVLVKLDELIARSPVGTVVHLVSDDVTAELELIAWSERTGQEVLESRKEGKLYHFIVVKKKTDRPQA